MKRILTSIWFLSLIVAIPVFFLLPPVFEKYTCDIISSGNYRNANPNKGIFYEDIDNDGKLERFETFFQRDGHSLSFHYFAANGGMIDQINLPIDFYEERNHLYFADFDNDKHKEVYVFSYRNDSLIMGWIQLTPSVSEFKQISICPVNTYNGGLLDYQIDDVFCLDMDMDGRNELVFPFSGGYSVFPRQIFRVDPQKQTIIKSENTGCANTKLVFVDLNDDGKMEIIADGAVSPIRDWLDAPHNTPAPYLKVLNSDLSYFFPPIKFFEGIQSFTNTHLIEGRDGKELLCTFLSSSSECKPLIIYRLNIKGEILDSVCIEEAVSQRSKYVLNTQKESFITQLAPSRFLEFNKNLSIIRSFHTGTQGDLAFVSNIDLNDDGVDEYFFDNRNTGEMIIMSDHFLWNTSLPISGKARFGIKKISKGEFLFYTQEEYYKLGFKKNLAYYLRYPLYLLIYSAVVSFIWILQMARMRQLKEKIELREKVKELQFLTLKNQLDPHFMFNTFNTIASVVKQGRSDEAYNVMIRFSKMVRRNFENPNEIYTTLKSELDFVEDYLEIQKFRFKDLFEYKIEIAPPINLTVPIPKLLLQIHVENALIHGIKPKAKEGLIVIHVQRSGSKLLVQIEDNGVGRDKAEKLRTGGNRIGLKTIRQIIEHSNLNTKHKITQNIIDIFDKEGKPGGTRIEIYIHHV
ncbi:histidine kinase [uncultured Draconibacterium sp.]|uniref:histidine kinase n=1 Tax=uncultured Draconibacterium sp. TaxID=1573823 RepID=UPI002AA8B2F7|nr:histidine kinase [uncultured Draconibacterium sp.]